RAVDRHGRAGLSEPRVRILQLVSCRGWSSDAYWAARVSRELERRGHQVTLGCRAGSEARVIAPARSLGVRRTETFAFASGIAPLADAADVRRLVAKLAETDIVHVHRGKEHWLAAAANRLSRTPRPIVRTRHIAQAVRPHAANRWPSRTAGLDAQLTVSGFADDVPRALATLDLVLYVPLESDGMSRVVFECLAAGRPLIASRVGVVPEVLTDGVNAALVPAGDAAALADAIARLLGEPAAGDGVRYRALRAGKYPGFLRRLPALLALIDGDFIVASKPRPTSYGLGLLARSRRRRPLLLDIDDWELGFLYRSGLWGRAGRALDLADPNGLAWTWATERLVRRADARTAASRFLA